MNIYKTAIRSLDNKEAWLPGPEIAANSLEEASKMTARLFISLSPELLQSNTNPARVSSKKSASR